MISRASELARRLARDAEAVCRHYLSQGKRQGRYWVVGDVANTPGGSLYVRLHGPDGGPGAAGKWTDGSTGEHGDLLDLIRLNRDLPTLRDTLREARSFLSLPQPAPSERREHTASREPSQAALRLFDAGRPVPGTLAESYLRARGIAGPLDWPSLRFHPSVFYRETYDTPLEVWPALLAAVTDLDGRITGVHRTFLDPRHPAKAPLATPRRALGNLLGNGVRFGAVTDVVAVGEGLETMLALKSALPSLPMIAGLSANHLAAINLGPNWRRLYIARDNDAAGIRAAGRLLERARTASIEGHMLIPRDDDFNRDLKCNGIEAVRTTLLPQLRSEDCGRF